MNNYDITNERISDYGCRKVLGMNVPVTSYINGYKYSQKDSFVSGTKNVKNKNSSKKVLSYLALLGGAALAIAGFIKRKNGANDTSKIVENAKTGIISKIKNLFKKMPVKK